MRLPPRSSLYLQRVGRAVLRVAGWGAGVSVFAVLAAALHARHDWWLDTAVLDAFASARTPALTDVVLMVTRLGDTAVLAVVSVVGVATLCLRRHWHSAIYLGIVTASAGILNTVLKSAFGRARPDLAVYVAEGFAFPSGHSMGSAATYGAVAVIVASRYPRWRRATLLLCVAVVALVGVSRAYLGVHYPSDVLAGWALGATLPLWTKSLLIGRGFRASRIADPELEADNFAPSEVERQERSG